MSKNRQYYSIVRLGSQKFILPMEKAMELVNLLTDAKAITTERLDDKYVDMAFPIDTPDVWGTKLELHVVSEVECIRLTALGERFIMEKGAK